MVYPSNDANGGRNTNYGHPYSCYNVLSQDKFYGERQKLLNLLNLFYSRAPLKSL